VKTPKLDIRHATLVDVEPRGDTRVQLSRRYAEVNFNGLIKGEFVGR